MCLALGACGAPLDTEEAEVELAATESALSAAPLESELRQAFGACSLAHVQWDEAPADRVCEGNWRFTERQCTRPSSCGVTEAECEPGHVVAGTPNRNSATWNYTGEVQIHHGDCKSVDPKDPTLPCSPPRPGQPRPVNPCKTVCKVTSDALKAGTASCAEKGANQFKTDNDADIKAQNVFYGSSTGTLGGFAKLVSGTLYKYPCTAVVTFDKLTPTTVCNLCRYGEPCSSSPRLNHPNTTARRMKELAAPEGQGRSVSGEECTTCDDQALGNPTQINTCLASFEGTADKAALDARRLLLFELSYDKLKDQTPGTLDALRTSLNTRIAGTPSCGLPKTQQAIGFASSCWNTSNGLDTQLLRCRRLLLDHVSPRARAEELPMCAVALFDKASVLEGSCAESAQTAVYDTVVALVRSSLEAQPTDTRQVYLARAFKAIMAAWNASATSWLDDEERKALLDRTLDAFWRGAYAAWLGSNTDQVARFVRTGIEVDFEVLAQAHDAASELRSIPLLWITSDALTAFMARAGDAAKAHDLVCKTLGCNKGKGNYVSESMRMVRSLRDATSLAAALKLPAPDGKDAAEAETFGKMRTAFSAISLRHERLLAALSDAHRLATGNGAAAEACYERGSDDLGAWGAGLFAQMMAADDLVRTFDVIGTFTAEHRCSPREGQEDPVCQPALLTDGYDSLAALRATARTLADNVSKALGDDEQVRERTFKALVGELQQRTTGARLTAELKDLEIRARSLTGDLFATRLRVGREVDALDGELKRVQEKIEKGELGAPPFAVISDQAFLVGQEQVKHKGGALTGSIAEIAVSTDKGTLRETLKPGDLLRVSAGGQYVASCGLEKDLKEDLSAAVTGPWGYVDALSVGESHVVGVSTSREEFESKSTTDSMCAQASVGANSPYASASVSRSRCQTTTRGVTNRTAESDTQSRERRSVASFELGARSTTVPFPDAPAGALLAVMVKADSSSRVHDVRVVRGSVTFTADEDVDVYLVVNDRTGCSPRSTDQLQVQVARMSSPETTAERFTEKLGAAVKALRGETADVLATGTLLPAEAARLRSNALSALAGFLEPVRALGAQVIDGELAQLAYAARAIELERALDLLLIQLSTASSVIALNQEETRVTFLWARAGLDVQGGRTREAAGVSAVGRRLDLLVDFARSQLLPAVELLAPEAKNSFLARTAEAQRPLLEAQISTPVAQRAATIVELIGDLDAVLLASAKNVKSETVAVTFVNPAHREKLCTWPAQDLAGLGIAAAPHRAANAMRSAAVFDDLENGRTPSFTVVPEDLYSLDTDEIYRGRKLAVKGALPCGARDVIVRDMAVAVLSKVGVNEQSDAIKPALVAPAVQRFVNERGMRFVTGASGSVIETTLPLIGGYPSEAFGYAQNLFDKHKQDAGRRRGAGLSPFGTFTVDLNLERHAAFYLDSAEAIVLVFDVQYREGSGKLDTIATCRAGAQLVDRCLDDRPGEKWPVLPVSGVPVHQGAAGESACIALPPATR